MFEYVNIHSILRMRREETVKRLKMGIQFQFDNQFDRPGSKTIHFDVFNLKSCVPLRHEHAGRKKSISGYTGRLY